MTPPTPEAATRQVPGVREAQAGAGSRGSGQEAPCVASPGALPDSDRRVAACGIEPYNARALAVLEYVKVTTVYQGLIVDSVEDPSAVDGYLEGIHAAAQLLHDRLAEILHNELPSAASEIGGPA